LGKSNDSDSELFPSSRGRRAGRAAGNAAGGQLVSGPDSAGVLAGVLGDPIAIQAIDHVVLRVRDEARALAFYCGVLGCREERRIPEIGLVQLRAGAALIDLMVVGAGEPQAVAPAGRNLDHFALRLGAFDAEALRRHLEAHGVSAGRVERRYGAEGFGPSIYVSDPDGNVVELKGPPEPG
jgi:catechol 2,3-dioxygenase-like lactoylglutathione lyase family enzyme